ncbi:hypothetical protein HZB01_01560 [Candidatus Woesearchaeota archaeon]|nr:hypothetical protein [Candidatus Woesearchaeota archaeon]
MAQEQYPAVVLAGTRMMDSLSDKVLWHAVSWWYGEQYLWTGNKNLQRIPGEINGVEGEYPLLEYTLATLQKASAIGDVVVVGPTKDIEHSLDGRLTHYKKVRFVDQSTTLGRNAERGHLAIGRQPALYMAGDCAIRDDAGIDAYGAGIEEFLAQVTALGHGYNLVFPVVAREVCPVDGHFSKRPYFSLLPDRMEGVLPGTPIPIRVTNFLWVNAPVNPDVADQLHGLRKFRYPGTVASLAWNVGLSPVAEYFTKGGFPQSLIEDGGSRYIGGLLHRPDFKLKIVKILGEISTHDVDSQEDLDALKGPKKQ